MRITYIAQDIDSVSGLGRIALAYATAMTSAGHDITLLCQRSSAPGMRRAIVPGFPGVRSVDKLLFRVSEPVRSLAARGDIRHAFGIGSRADIVSAQSCHRSGVEFQKNLPSERIRRRNFGLYDMLSLQDEHRLMTSPRTRLVLAVSDLVRSQLIRWYGLPEEKIIVLPNGIDTARYATPLDRDAARERYRMPKGSFILGFLGNEFDRKGVQTIIEALPLLRDLPLSVCVAGADDPTPYIRRADALSVGGRVHFIGRVREPEEFLRTLDMFVFPVNYEPFGMVVTEAMAAGVPVITARAVGAVEGMTSGQEGLFLDDPLSATELASAIRRLVADPVLRDHIARTGRQAASAFDWHVICSRLETVYRTVNAASRGSR